MKYKPNTVWDYLMPLSLIGLQFLALNYGLTHYTIYEPYQEPQIIKKSLLEISNFLFVEIGYVAFIIFTTIFLTRFQRIFSPLLVPVFLFVIYISVFGNLQGFVLLLVFSVFFISPTVIGVLSLFIKFGNNLTEKITKKSSPSGSALAWGIYGLGLTILPLSSFSFTFPGANVKSEFIFGGLYRLLEPIVVSEISYILFFPLLFLLIGYIVEKYKQRGAKP